MIQSIVLQPLRNGEFIQFIFDFLNILEKNNPDVLKVRPQFDSLKSITDEMENLFKLSQASLITAEIEALDLRRDRAITGISYIATGYTYHPNEVLATHGKVLEAHFALFGSNITRDNYLSQTTSVRNILNDWDTKPEMQAAIAGLSLTEWKAELKAANDAFYDAYTRRNEQLASANPDSLRTKRLDANAAYYRLRDRLNGHFEVNDGAEPWVTVSMLANQSISNYNALLARRGSAGATTTEEEPTPTLAG